MIEQRVNMFLKNFLEKYEVISYMKFIKNFLENYEVSYEHMRVIGHFCKLAVQ